MPLIQQGRGAEVLPMTGDPWVALSDAQPTGDHRGRHQRWEPRRTPHTRRDRGHPRACFDAGAAIVHNHIDIVGDAATVAARYREGWEPVLAERPDALVYPTINGVGDPRRGSATSLRSRSRARSASASSTPVP